MRNVNGNGAKDVRNVQFQRKYHEAHLPIHWSTWFIDPTNTTTVNIGWRDSATVSESVNRNHMLTICEPYCPAGDRSTSSLVRSSVTTFRNIREYADEVHSIVAYLSV